MCHVYLITFSRRACRLHLQLLTARTSWLRHLTSVIHLTSVSAHLRLQLLTVSTTQSSLLVTLLPFVCQTSIICSVIDYSIPPRKFMRDKECTIRLLRRHDPRFPYTLQRWQLLLFSSPTLVTAVGLQLWYLIYKIDYLCWRSKRRWKKKLVVVNPYNLN